MYFDDTSIHKICILSWGLIGDVFIRTPVIEAVKKRFPAASIDVVVDPSSVGVLLNHPDINKVIPYSRKKKPALRYLAHSLRNILLLRRAQYDLCINLYCGGSSPLISRLTGARYRLSYNHTPSLRWANNLQADTPSFCGNWIEALAKMLAPLGIPPEQVRRGTSFYVTDAAGQRAAELLHGLQQPIIGLNLGAGPAIKRWPLSDFLALTRQISETYPVQFVLFTNPGMEHLAAEFTAQFVPAERLRTMPLLSLDEVGAVMQECAAMITGDTSLMHMSFGLKRPTLVLFTSTRPEVVEPVDCLHQDCFVPDPTQTDPCGNPLGSKEIPVGLVLEKFAMLVQQANLIQ
ncbi:MAG: glycosyltransferase family 9 protein [Gammaproteobacteria bacterium]|nr:glycosyltransferase family 9 protein [Gammaproteobacteria bacterium]MDH5651851.1 glycosyltransferase family 9 protein [Gammaproteobacteria bacterium]